MPHLFISYAKADTRDLALSLSDKLNAIDGVTAWVDRSLRAGKSWELQIQSEIDRCDAMIVLYSPDLNRHKEGKPESYVLTEIAYAKYTANKRIIPVMAQRTNPPISMTLEHYIDFTLADLTVDNLIEVICDQMGISISWAKPPTASSERHLSDSDHIVIPPEVSASSSDTSNHAQAIPIMPDNFASAITQAESDNGLDWLLDETLLDEALRIEAEMLHTTKSAFVSADTIPNLMHSPAILPPPFEWIEIPSGSVTIQLKTETIPTFHIAKYPITNAQYSRFIEAGGYTQKKWWTEAGWSQREEDAWTEPRFWTDSKWNGIGQPVVGVSWYEAVAFCQWLSDMTSENVILPTEQQWQRAAQGDDDRIYPWGNDWDCKRCNNSVTPCKSIQTTPVRQYEGKGDSFFKVVDMAGNVWEWCRTADYTGSQVLNGTDVRVLRGGSWNNAVNDYSRCDLRYRNVPYYGYIDMGFRVSRS
jgi:formylglycine-generating enzyme required for sulfatase activity